MTGVLGSEADILARNAGSRGGQGLHGRGGGKRKGGKSSGPGNPEKEMSVAKEYHLLYEIPRGGPNSARSNISERRGGEAFVFCDFLFGPKILSDKKEKKDKPQEDNLGAKSTWNDCMRMSTKGEIREKDFDREKHNRKEKKKSLLKGGGG